jgi:WhiB family redox-sensing transcriptional regulator
MIPAPRVRPARPVSLHFSRGHIPPTPTAACARHNPDLWFSDSPQNIARAKAICQECADQAPCLAGAIDRRETYGVWGGTDLNPEHHQEAVA